ncbi:zinc finger protein 678-like [Drosophila takahashii]|uniref:zinc finger protein 678-like n=1 Tax=Drosophila takahashii TaxID=29030 RepID=UPI003899313E
MEEICRVCLGNYDNMVNIFEGTQESGPSIPDMIALWSGYQVRKGDSFPESICSICLEDARNAFEIQKSSKAGLQFLCQVTKREHVEEEVSSATQNLSYPVKDTTLAEPESNELNELPVQFYFFEDEILVSESEQSDGQFVEEMYQSKAPIQDDEVYEISGDETEQSDCQIEDSQDIDSNHNNQKTDDNTNSGNDKSLVCPYCQKIYQRKWNLKLHIRTHSGERPYKCSQCTKSFTRSCYLISHMADHTGELPFKCRYCPRAYRFRSSCSRHMQRHRDALKDDVQSPEEKQSKTLEVKDPTKESHIMTHTGTEPKLMPSEDHSYTCSVCLKTFNDHASLMVHNITHKAKSMYKCPICPMSFDLAHERNRHSRTHEGEKAFKCTHCHRSYRQLKELNRHIRAHTGEKQFECDHCPKSFVYVSHLNQHLRCHSAERPHKCDICSMTFRRMDGLKRHLQFHGEERPYKCDYCPKTFKYTASVRMHIRVHTGERPFKCRECEKTYKQPCDLKRHMRTHTGERPFKCDYCEKAFTDLSTVNAHIRTHTGERPYKCSYCQKSFSQLSSLNNHLFIHKRELQNGAQET